jgi:hypothetical protein
MAAGNITGSHPAEIGTSIKTEDVLPNFILAK